MSVQCPHCGAVAGYGREPAHRSDCPALGQAMTARAEGLTMRERIAAPTSEERDAAWERYQHYLTNLTAREEAMIERAFKGGWLAYGRAMIAEARKS